MSSADFRVLDAEQLELADASVDGVLNRFGYILRGDPPPALREIRRVLRPGGRLAFAVWAARELNPWMTVPADVMVERGHLHPPDEAERRLSARRNPESIARLLEEAGFGEPEIEELAVAYRFADAEELWLFVSELRGPVALALDRLPEEERGEIRQEVENRTPRADNGFELGGISLNVASRSYHRRPGALAEWLGSGLQSRLQRFESARRLYSSTRSERARQRLRTSRGMLAQRLVADRR